MSDIKHVLENLSQSLQVLEDAVAEAKQTVQLKQDKIDALQQALQTTYERLDMAIEKLESETKIDAVAGSELALRPISTSDDATHNVSDVDGVLAESKGDSSHSSELEKEEE